MAKKIRAKKLDNTREAGLRQAANLIPTNWLDPILSGPEAVNLPFFPWNGQHIEKLMLAVKKRIEDAAIRATRRPSKSRKVKGFVLAPVLGWIVVAWFAGMIAADVTHDSKMKRVSHGAVLCRPWCYMSGSFYDGVVRPAAPWPFRKGKYFECPRQGERDYCTGEKFTNGKWEPCAELIEGSWLPGEPPRHLRGIKFPPQPSGKEGGK